MHFGFALDSWNTDFLDIDLLDTDLDSLLGHGLKQISYKYFVCLQDVFKTSSRHVFKASWKTKNCYAEDVLKTSLRHVLRTSSRRLPDQQMFAGDRSFIKRQTSGTSNENKWQRMTTSDKEWYNEWQQMTSSDNEWCNKRQRVTTSNTTSDNK